MSKSYDKNGHRRTFTTLEGMWAYLEKPVRGQYRPVYLVDKPTKPIRGKRRLRHT